MPEFAFKASQPRLVQGLARLQFTPLQSLSQLAGNARMRSVKESTLRARARKLGYAIHKSRSRSIHEDNLGRYALVKEDSNRVVLGERFDASLEEIAEYLD